MKLSKEVKKFVMDCCTAVNEKLDYLEDLVEEHLRCIAEATSPITEDIIMWDDYTLSKVKNHMIDCENMIELIVKIILLDDHFECEDLDMCYRMYFECSNRYEEFKENSYKKLLSKNYLKVKINKNYKKVGI